MSQSQPTLEQLRERHGTRFKWLVLLTVMIGSMASILSSTIVNVAVPDLSQHFTSLRSLVTLTASTDQDEVQEPYTID